MRTAPGKRKTSGKGRACEGRSPLLAKQLLRRMRHGSQSQAQRPSLAVQPGLPAADRAEWWGPLLTQMHRPPSSPPALPQARAAAGVGARRHPQRHSRLHLRPAHPAGGGFQGGWVWGGLQPGRLTACSPPPARCLLLCCPGYCSGCLRAGGGRCAMCPGPEGPAPLTPRTCAPAAAPYGPIAFVDGSTCLIHPFGALTTTIPGRPPWPTCRPLWRR